MRKTRLFTSIAAAILLLVATIGAILASRDLLDFVLSRKVAASVTPQWTLIVAVAGLLLILGVLIESRREARPEGTRRTEGDRDHLTLLSSQLLRFIDEREAAFGRALSEAYATSEPLFLAVPSQVRTEILKPTIVKIRAEHIAAAMDEYDRRFANTIRKIANHARQFGVTGQHLDRLSRYPDYESLREVAESLNALAEMSQTAQRKSVGRPKR